MQDLSLNTEVWVAGKGPSIDIFPWHKAKQIIGINETAFFIPNCWGAATTDFNILKKYIKDLDDSIVVISKKSEPMIYFKNHIVWEMGREVKKFVGGTVNLLVRVLAYHGVKKIHFVGFESVDGDLDYSKRILRMNAFSMNAKKYYDINEYLFKALEETGIKPVWEHRNV